MTASRIIDGHAHVTPGGRWFGTSLDGSVDALLRDMDRSRVTRALILPVPTVSGNRFMADVQRAHPDRLVAFGSLSCEEPESAMVEIRELGLRGIKFHPRLQRRSLEEWDRLGFVARAEEEHLPIVVCGWPQSSTIPMRSVLPMTVDGIAKKYPSLRIVLAHAGGHRFWDAFFCARSNANVYLDCSYFSTFFAGTSIAHDFFAMLPRIDRKIIFGSDFPEVSIGASLASITGPLAGTDFDLARLLSDNVREIIG